jgi:hypothetical protein
MLVANTAAPEIAGVWERLTRSWRDPSPFAPDAKHRIGKLLKIRDTMVWAAPHHGAPQVQVRTPAGIIVRASPARTLKVETRRSITEKFIRGFHFAETGSRAGAFKLETFLKRNSEVEQPLITLVSLAEKHPDLAPGLFYARLHGPETSFWAFHIWGQFNLFAMTTPSISPPPPGPTEAKR